MERRGKLSRLEKREGRGEEASKAEEEREN